MKSPDFSRIAAGLIFSATIMPLDALVSIESVVGGTFAPTIDNSYGALEFALNMGGPSLVRDGISFSPPNASSGGSSLLFLSNAGIGGTIDVTGLTYGGVSWSELDFGTGDELFHTISYPDFSEGYSIQITGLDPARSYQVQLLFGDPRTLYPYSQNVTVYDSFSTFDNAQLEYGLADGTRPFAMLTAKVAGSTSFTFESPPSPLLSGLVVHSIPEPSTVAGLVIGGFLLAGRRCRFTHGGRTKAA